jgi:hypothetical protein
LMRERVCSMGMWSVVSFGMRKCYRGVGGGV